MRTFCPIVCVRELAQLFILGDPTAQSALADLEGTRGLHNVSVHGGKGTYHVLAFDFMERANLHVGIIMYMTSWQEAQMFHDADEMVEDELHRNNAVNEAVQRADEVIMREGRNAEEMQELVLDVCMRLLQKSVFYCMFERERKRVEARFKDVFTDKAEPQQPAVEKPEPKGCRIIEWRGRWIVAHGRNNSLAWSGSRWVPIGGDVQVSNFSSPGDAEKYAVECGLLPPAQKAN